MNKAFYLEQNGIGVIYNEIVSKEKQNHCLLNESYWPGIMNVLIATYTVFLLTLQISPFSEQTEQ